MVDLKFILECLLRQKEEQREQESWAPEELWLEDIRPEDLPPGEEGFPKPEPHKRVIVLDI